MSPVLALVPDLPDEYLDPRYETVTGLLTPGWRPNEWDPYTLTLTLDTTAEQSAMRTCRVADCTKTTRSHHLLCAHCRRNFVASGEPDVEVWVTTARRTAPERGGADVRTQRCKVERDGQRCQRVIRTRTNALCAKHDSSYRGAKRRGKTEAEWLAVATPYGPGTSCRATFCESEAITRGLCVLHYTRWQNADKPADVQAWVETQDPVVNAREVWLGGLTPLALAEMLWVLQTRDAGGSNLDTAPVRVLTRAAQKQRCESLLDVKGPFVGATGVFERQVRDMLAVLYADRDRARAADVWDLRELGLHAGRERGARPLLVDFRPVRQPWLREMIKAYIETGVINRSDNVRASVSAIAMLSDAIALGPGNADPTRLGRDDIDRFITTLKAAPLGTSRKGRFLGVTRTFLRHARQEGWLEDTPGQFDFRQSDVIDRDDPEDDDLEGKAIPEHVIRQLDTQVHLLDTSVNRMPLGLTLTSRLHRLAYELLRDTGRRLSDIAALPLDCTTTSGDGPTLIYDNIKARRRGRHLPIERRTSDAIAEVSDLVAATFPDTPRSELWLFPRPTRNPRGTVRTSPDSIGAWMDTWYDQVTVRDTHVDANGAAAAFPRERLYSHAFRHAYAQRLADAGTHPDVLRELMDHKSLATTMIYYNVSVERRREAVEQMSALRIDRRGNPTGQVSAVAYGRQSVAVPYGNCQEPSNVAAGGSACPIRFQCAGCSHYRPDPSFLPAIETHIAELMANREEARAADTAEWVIDGIEAELSAYRAITRKMQTDLADLDPDTRAAVEEASVILRKARVSAAAMSPPAPAPTLLQIGRHRPEGTS